MSRAFARWMMLVPLVQASVLWAQTATSQPTPKPAPKPVAVVTPMAERVVTMAALNKDSGRVLRFNARPGQVLRFENLIIRVKACAANPPWEKPQEAAFVQVEEQKGEGQRRIFSGWLFAQAPGVNALEHPRYDVWVMRCAMRFPEIGPDTIVAGKGASAASSASSAPKSPDRPSAASNRAR